MGGGQPQETAEVNIEVTCEVNTELNTERERERERERESVQHLWSRLPASKDTTNLGKARQAKPAKAK
ncbi:hypothetical protein BH11CYA1_BH11CYA1_47400 [soil metagenome]